MSGVNRLVVDGVAGPATFNAIYEFQRQVVRLLLPDGRMSPGGMTFEKLDEMAKLHPAHSISEVISYKSDIPPNRRAVSPYSIAVVAWAVRMAGMNGAVITDTFRTAEKQAELMYRNAKMDLQNQRKLYNSQSGLAVLDVYEMNAGKSEGVVLDLMTKKIKEIKMNDITKFKHVISVDEYKQINVFDIGVNSTRSVSGITYNESEFTKCLKKSSIRVIYISYLTKLKCQIDVGILRSSPMHCRFPISTNIEISSNDVTVAIFDQLAPFGA